MKFDGKKKTVEKVVLLYQNSVFYSNNIDIESG